MEPNAVNLSLLSAMITPAVLISACGMLILSTSARLARVIDRARTLSGSDESQEVRGQVSLYARRGRLIQASLATFYLALGLFVATTISIGLVAFWPRAAWVPTVLGITGTVVFFGGCLTLIAETRLALRAVNSVLDALARPRSRIQAS